MGVSCSVFTYETERTVLFETNSNSLGRHLLKLVVSDPQQQIIRFRIPGPDGNVVGFCGQMDRRIKLFARYIGDQESVKVLTEVDKLDWSASQVSIIDEAGQEFPGMTLVPNSYTEIRSTTCAGPLSNSGETGVRAAFLECSFEFQQDAPGI